MNARKLMFAAIPAIAFVLASCNGGGGSSGSGTPENTPITNSTDASKAASSGTDSGLLAPNSTSALSGLVEAMGVPAMRSPLASNDPKFAKLIAAQAKAWQAPGAALAGAIPKAGTMRATGTNSGSASCTSGTGSWNSTWDDVAGTFSATLSYSKCRVADVEFDGSVTLSGNAAFDAAGNPIALNISSTVSAFTAKFYADGVSTTPIADFSMNLGMGATVDFRTLARSLSADGKEELRELAANGLPTATYSIDFANVRINGAGDALAGSSTFNGGVTQSWNVVSPADSGSISVTYYNLVFGWTRDGNGNVDWTLNGTLTTNFTPDRCFEGTFTFNTVKAVHQSETTGVRSAGQIVINGNTTVTYNSDGSVTVTFNSQSAIHPSGTFEGLCPVNSMDNAAL